MKRYAHRDIMSQGQVYCDHVQAMTAEDLHSKSDIAAELAHRDIQIAELRHDLTLANNNAAAAMRVANERQDELRLAKETLIWALDTGLMLCYDGTLAVDPPAHLRATIESVIGEKR